MIIIIIIENIFICSYIADEPNDPKIGNEWRNHRFDKIVTDDVNIADPLEDIKQLNGLDNIKLNNELKGQECHNVAIKDMNQIKNKNTNIKLNQKYIVSYIVVM